MTSKRTSIFFIEDKNVIDIKFQDSPSADVESALIMYEEPTVIKQKTFENRDVGRETDLEINSFLSRHDVIKVENYEGSGFDEITTVVTYKEHENE